MTGRVLGSGLSASEISRAKSLEVYSDEAVLALNKPAGLAVQTRDPSDVTLDTLMEAFAKSNGKKPRIVHRLDRETSGIILTARTKPDAVALHQAFEDRKVTKTYLAICEGEAVSAYGRNDKPLKRVSPREGLVISAVTDRRDGEGKPAGTLWRVISVAEGLSLLECQPRTGRMHQIRVHLADAGLPICGDPLYGLQGKRRSRTLLHALSVELPHPRTGLPLKVAAPVADDLFRFAQASGLDGALETALKSDRDTR